MSFPRHYWDITEVSTWEALALADTVSISALSRLYQGIATRAPRLGWLYVDEQNMYILRIGTSPTLTDDLAYRLHLHIAGERQALTYLINRDWVGERTLWSARGFVAWRQ